ncbi:MAG TPA: actin-binding WH2 domain-containing protein [Anaerolineae bacterium]|nr:actin-binding WH2 domain-containing protein [Anaerolineae bacterium]
MRTIFQHLVNSFALIEYVLRQRLAYFTDITAQTELWSKLGRLLTVAGLGFFLFGLVMGLGGALGWAALFSALKLPLLFLASGAICLPTLYYFSIVFGSRLRFLQTMTLILTAQAVAAVLVLGATPISLLFLFSGAAPAFLVLLNVGILALAATLGLIFLVQGVLYVQETQPPESVTWLQWGVMLFKGNLRSAVLLSWLVIYGLVGAQMSWALRPFFGVALEGRDFFSAVDSAITLWLNMGR